MGDMSPAALGAVGGVAGIAGLGSFIGGATSSGGVSLTGVTLGTLGVAGMAVGGYTGYHAYQKAYGSKPAGHSTGTTAKPTTGYPKPEDLSSDQIAADAKTPPGKSAPVLSETAQAQLNRRHQVIQERAGQRAINARNAGIGNDGALDRLFNSEETQRTALTPNDMASAKSGEAKITTAPAKSSPPPVSTHGINSTWNSLLSKVNPFAAWAIKRPVTPSTPAQAVTAEKPTTPRLAHEPEDIFYDAVEELPQERATAASARKSAAVAEPTHSDAYNPQDVKIPTKTAAEHFAFVK